MKKIQTYCMIALSETELNQILVVICPEDYDDDTTKKLSFRKRRALFQMLTDAWDNSELKIRGEMV